MPVATSSSRRRPDKRAAAASVAKRDSKPSSTQVPATKAHRAAAAWEQETVSVRDLDVLSRCRKLNSFFAQGLDLTEPAGAAPPAATRPPGGVPTAAAAAAATVAPVSPSKGTAPNRPPLQLTAAEGAALWDLLEECEQEQVQEQEQAAAAAAPPDKVANSNQDTPAVLPLGDPAGSGISCPVQDTCSSTGQAREAAVTPGTPCSSSNSSSSGGSSRVGSSAGGGPPAQQASEGKGRLCSPQGSELEVLDIIGLLNSKEGQEEVQGQGKQQQHEEQQEEEDQGANQEEVYLPAGAAGDKGSSTPGALPLMAVSQQQPGAADGATMPSTSSNRPSSSDCTSSSSTSSSSRNSSSNGSNTPASTSGPSYSRPGSYSCPSEQQAAAWLGYYSYWGDQVMVVQRRWRARQQRRRFLELRRAALVLQGVWRGIQVREDPSNPLVRARAAAAAAAAAQQEFLARRQQQGAAAGVLQRSWRVVAARAQLQRLRQEALQQQQQQQQQQQKGVPATRLEAAAVAGRDASRGQQDAAAGPPPPPSAAAKAEAARPKATTAHQQQQQPQRSSRSRDAQSSSARDAARDVASKPAASKPRASVHHAAAASKNGSKQPAARPVPGREEVSGVVSVQLPAVQGPPAARLEPAAAAEHADHYLAGRSVVVRSQADLRTANTSCRGGAAPDSSSCRMYGSRVAAAVRQRAQELEVGEGAGHQQLGARVVLASSQHRDIHEAMEVVKGRGSLRGV